MRTRFYNARILNKDLDIIEGEIFVEGNRITHVGDDILQKAKTIHWDREIDVEKNLLIPGFKNTHSHSAMTGLRSFADDLPLMEWLQEQIFPIEKKMTPEDVYYMAILANMEYVTSGITTNYDMYFFPEMVAKASVDCGFRTVLSGALNTFISSIKEEEKNFLYLNQYDELISYRFGFHGEYTNTKENLIELSKLADRYDAPVFGHIAESKAEVAGCIERYGMSPVAYLDSIGMFAHGGGGYHCIHMSDEDLDIFARRGLYAVTNSSANMKLASGIARLSDMKKKGIRLAIGTDGPASNNCLDMFREMFLVTALAKIKEEDAAAMPAEFVLEMAVSTGAKAMGIDADALEVGKLADIAMIDLKWPNMQPLNNIVKNIVYSGSKQNVKLTMVNGKVLYEDGKFYFDIDEEEIYTKANQIITRLRG